MRALETSIPTSTALLPYDATPARDIELLKPEMRKYHYPEKMFGVHPSQKGTTLEHGLWWIMHEVLGDPHKPMKLSGSITSDRESCSRMGTASSRIFEPLVSKKLHPRFLVDEEPQDTNLNNAFCLDMIRPSELSERVEAWRRVYMYLSPNADYVLTYRTSNPNNDETLFHVMTALQTFSQRYARNTVSLVDNRAFRFVRIRNPQNELYSGTNIIGLPRTWEESHTQATTLRNTQSKTLKWHHGFPGSEPGYFIEHSKDDYYQLIRLLRNHTRFGSWLNDVVRTIRSMSVIGIPIQQLDIQSFLERKPSDNTFVFADVASIIANYLVADQIDPYLTASVIEKAGLNQHLHQETDILRLMNDVHDIESILFESGSGPSLAGNKFLLSLFSAMPVSCDHFYSLVPPHNKRDRVIQHTTVPLSYGASNVVENTKHLIRQTVEANPDSPFAELAPCMLAELDVYTK